MARPKTTNSRVTDLIGLLIVGAGVGWLVGMSVSPVVSIVITSVTATAAAIIAVLSGLEDTRSLETDDLHNNIKYVPKRVRVGPLVALVIGIVLGAAVGLSSRSSSVFGSDLDAEISKWTKYGRTQKDVADILFAAAYPQTGSDAAPNRSWAGDPIGVLFGSSADLASACISLTSLEGAELRKFAKGSSLEGVRQIADAVEDPATLKAVLEVICPAE